MSSKDLLNQLVKDAQNSTGFFKKHPINGFFNKKTPKTLYMGVLHKRDPSMDSLTPKQKLEFMNRVFRRKGNEPFTDPSIFDNTFVGHL
jgi:hypothetical protein